MEHLTGCMISDLEIVQNLKYVFILCFIFFKIVKNCTKKKNIYIFSIWSQHFEPIVFNLDKKTTLSLEFKYELDLKALHTTLTRYKVSECFVMVLFSSFRTCSLLLRFYRFGAENIENLLPWWCIFTLYSHKKNKNNRQSPHYTLQKGQKFGNFHF